MVFFGDLFQLPPVVEESVKEILDGQYASPYFFSAKILEQLDMEFVELEKVYRQKDNEFIRLLNAIRNNSITDDDIALFNKRHDSQFTSPSGSFYLSLTSTNDLADGINEEQLAKLPGKIWKAQGMIDGEFSKEYLPTATELKLKKGAQIMLLNNDTYGRWINGTIGKITGFENDDDGEEIIAAKLDNGESVEISPYTWKIYRFFLKDNELCSEDVGSFTQYPIRLAFAITIHKSQGKTFENVIIDVGRGTFAHGQMYVALSRCTSLDGIILKQPLKKSHVLMDWHIVKFLTRTQYDKAEQKCSHDDKLQIIRSAIREKRNLDILYLKAKDEKSRRTIRPMSVGEMEYNGHPFLGMNAYCLMRKARRVFNVDRILEVCVS